MNCKSKKQRQSNPTNCYAMAVNNASRSLSMKQWWLIEWVKYGYSTTCLLTQAAKLLINAYVNENALIKMLIFAYGTENADKICLYLLTEKNAYKFCLFCLTKNLLTEFAYQNVLIEEFAFICLKTSFYAEIFSTIKSAASRPRWNLAFAMSHFFLNFLPGLAGEWM